MHYDALLATHEIMGMRVSSPYTGCYKITEKCNRFRDRSFLLSNVIIQKQTKLGIIDYCDTRRRNFVSKGPPYKPSSSFSRTPCVFARKKGESKRGRGV